MDMKIEATMTLNNQSKMPRLGLGVYGIPSGQATVEVVSWALQAGYRHIDTAKFYRNEISVGKAIRGSGIARDKIWVTTKLFPTDYFRAGKAFEASLSKLDLEYIDLYLVHFPIPGTLKVVWKQMEAIYKSGRVRAIGVSNYNVRQLQATLDIASVAPSVNQMRCSVFGYDKVVYKLCQQQNVAFEAYSPLTRGKQLNNKELAQIAENYNRSPAQVLLRWALQKNMIIIPKSQHQKRIIDNANIFDFAISDSDMQTLETFST